ncbi:hypothetical protein CPB85DRAFT_1525099 [Mucidula mucida]|nr:hypothetical protein CPB85DRAFT_1525099 [Mucidula mucida]
MWRLSTGAVYWVDGGGEEIFWASRGTASTYVSLFSVSINWSNNENAKPPKSNQTKARRRWGLAILRCEHLKGGERGVSWDLEHLQRVRGKTDIYTRSCGLERQRCLRMPAVTSLGRSTSTGPGRPDVAILNASFILRGSSEMSLIRTFIFTVREMPITSAS